MILSLLEKKSAIIADRMIDALVLAFSTDPAVRWLYPNAQQYLQHFPEFVHLLGGSAFETGTARTIGDDAGAALWLPPGHHPNHEELDVFLQLTVTPDLQTIFAVFEQMSRYHPAEPHWYLVLLGVEPARQRQGYGSALIKPALAECDRTSQLAYLESSNPNNIPFHEHHGFEVLTTIEINDSPPITPMIRYPRAGP